ncbi:MAG: cyclic nucleotide-binding domain-containing protein [Nitrospirae bacterium]|nr:cyclic nucleotide-binding domain-containing protein [Nitrospirota bacterium]
MGIFKKKVEGSEKLWETYFSTLKKQEWQKALQAIQSLKEAEPKNPNVFLKIGDLLQRTGQNKEAITAYHNAAWLLFNQGFQQKALAIYKIILKLDPYDEDALNKSKELLLELESSRLSPTVFTQEQVEMPSAITIEPVLTEEQVPAGSEFQEQAITSPLEEKVSWEIETGRYDEEKPAEKKTMPVPYLFSSFSKEQFQRIIEMAETSVYEDGHTVVEEGDTGDSIYIIKDGSAKVVAHILGKTIELAQLKEGDVFGEVAFLTGRPRTASVIAQGRLGVIEINRLLLEDVIEKNPKILDTLQDFYHSRVQETIKKVKEK